MAAVCVIAGVAIVYQSRTIAEQNRQLASLTEQNRQLAEQLRSASEGMPEPQSALPDSPPPSPAPGARKSNRPIDEARGEDETQPLRENLAEANATVARLEARIAELESQLEKVTADSKQSAANEETLNQNLAEATRTVESLQKETKNQSRRLSRNGNRQPASARADHAKHGYGVPVSPNFLRICRMSIAAATTM